MTGGGLRSWLAWLPQAALLGIARALPYRARLALGSAVLRAAVALVPSLRARVENNLQLIFPEMPPEERARIRRAMADNFGRTLLETVTVPQFHARAAWSEPAGPGWEPFLTARAEGKGALLVSGHFGQWEAVRGMLKARGIEAGALYRPVKNPHLQAIYFEQMSLSGAPLFPRSRQGMRELVRHLKLGRRRLRAARPVRAGRPADRLPRASGADRARDRRAGGAVQGADDPGLRDARADGLHVAIEFEPPIPVTTAEEMTQAAADSLAARVRAKPEQYYWLHRRWVKRFDDEAG